ncbi:hypothetical protein TrRE_jg13115 [Triparma retinervis]|uniref:Uncharacterized protein n=1 Tax=Triparma retinervis TaxID=2557542 RepID=A0A9W7DK89_9STRA|nr:hypothetical protein TrRE_jg13115 [Triparma retinervis]
MWAGRRIGRVVAYDDATGTQMIRYASQIRGAKNDDELTTIADMLDFNGGEARLLALAPPQRWTKFPRR